MFLLGMWRKKENPTHLYLPSTCERVESAVLCNMCAMGQETERKEMRRRGLRCDFGVQLCYHNCKWAALAAVAPVGRWRQHSDWLNLLYSCWPLKPGREILLSCWAIGVCSYQVFGPRGRKEWKWCWVELPWEKIKEDPDRSKADREQKKVGGCADRHLEPSGKAPGKQSKSSEEMHLHRGTVVKKKSMKKGFKHTLT